MPAHAWMNISLTVAADEHAVQVLSTSVLEWPAANLSYVTGPLLQDPHVQQRSLAHAAPRTNTSTAASHRRARMSICGGAAKVANIRGLYTVGTRSPSVGFKSVHMLCRPLAKLHSHRALETCRRTNWMDGGHSDRASHTLDGPSGRRPDSAQRVRPCECTHLPNDICSPNLCAASLHFCAPQKQRLSKACLWHHVTADSLPSRRRSSADAINWPASAA